MDPIERLVVWLGFEVDDKEAKRKVDGWLDALAGVVAVGAAAGAALVKLGVDAARAGDEAAKTARQFRLSAQELGELQFAADRSGLTASQISTGFRSLVRNAEAFGRGAGEATQAFAAFGITAADVKRLGTADLIDRIADGFARLEGQDAVPREAFLQRVFGDEAGGGFVNLLKDGSEGLRALRREATLLGITISEQDAKASERFVDSLTDLRAIAVGLARRIGFGMLPALQSWADWLRVVWDRNRMLVLSGLDRSIDLSTAALERMRGPLGAVVGLLTAWSSFRIAKESVDILKQLPGIGPVLTKLGARAPMVLGLAAGVLALVVALDDLAAFMAGEDSVLEDITDRLGITEELRSKLEQVRDLLLATKDALVSIGGNSWDWASVASTRVGRLAKALAAVVTSSREFQAAWAMSPLSGLDDAARWFTNWLANDKAAAGFELLAAASPQQQRVELSSALGDLVGISRAPGIAGPAVGAGGSGVRVGDRTANVTLTVNIDPNSPLDPERFAQVISDRVGKEVRVALEAP